MDLQDSQPVEQQEHVLESLAELDERAYILNRYLYRITCDVCQLLNSDWSIITVCEGTGGQVIASSLPLQTAEANPSLYGEITALLVQHGVLCSIDEIEHQLDYQDQLGSYTYALGIPLRTIYGKVVGTLYAFHHQPCQHSTEKISSVRQYAEQAAMAIDNHQLYQQHLDPCDICKAAPRVRELQRIQSKLANQERLAEIGEFTTQIVHEIRSPLTTIEMGLNYARKLLPGVTDQKRLILALNEAHRLKHLLTEILLYTKPQVLKRSKLNLNQFLNELLVELREMPEATERGIELICDTSDIYILADQDKLKQVFINLVRNAFEAISPGEKVSCEITRRFCSKLICINIHNGGTPIPPEVLPQLTTPFYSTKPSGTGLGLAIVKRIVTAHRGKLIIDSCKTGTTISVQLPFVS
ncbi:ATP-binding protein [Leptolyngbya sp. AN03gr2]|uniref:ATP-binding protein n=1 Tax=unclassified Leptolyngbya TaxID=2650499 RepID=UPI003D3225F5